MSRHITIKTYSKVISLPTYHERFEYLKLPGTVCHETFGGHRYLNQMLYRSLRWKRFRRDIILRDMGCDLGDEGYPINGVIIIHHLNPLSLEDITNERGCVFDPENAICVSHETHNAIHYSEEEPENKKEYVERTEYDTCPWRR